MTKVRKFVKLMSAVVKKFLKIVNEIFLIV